MATVNSAPTRPPPRSRAKASEAVQAYGLGDSILSFRYGLQARERDVLDQALAIVGRSFKKRHGVFSSPGAVKQYLHLQLAGERCEKFAVLYLDVKHRLIAFEIAFTGTLTQTSVYPREIITAALAHGAAAVVIAHNHPSGSTAPSRADEALTQTLKAALTLVEIHLLDHVIVGDGDALSMAERGMI